MAVFRNQSNGLEEYLATQKIDEATKNDLRRAYLGGTVHIPDLASVGQIGQLYGVQIANSITSNTPPQPQEAEPSKDPSSKKARREANQPQWRDLEVGDKFEHGDGMVPITKVTRERYYFEYEGIEHYSSKKATPIDVRFELHESVQKVGFDSVILPEEKKQQIMDAIKQIDNHDLIFKDWGFENTFEKGTAISLLFFGAPGTGKTLMAQAIADRFDYGLKIISTADIETPEPGGAERAIQKAFREADKDTVLLFDECDSLISSRKHMGSILAAQVNALLTELEHFKGIVVFTTNRVETLDEAFDRRLSLKLEFEMPNEEHRALIWARMFPKQAPLSKDVDFSKLATVEIAGGHIKNVVLRAARAAANTDLPNDKKKITQSILFNALIEEVKSMVAFTSAKDNEPLYGTPTLGRGKGRVEIRRG